MISKMYGWRSKCVWTVVIVFDCFVLVIRFTLKYVHDSKVYKKMQQCGLLVYAGEVENRVVALSILSTIPLVSPINQEVSRPVSKSQNSNWMRMWRLVCGHSQFTCYAHFTIIVHLITTYFLNRGSRKCEITNWNVQYLFYRESPYFSIRLALHTTLSGSRL